MPEFFTSRVRTAIVPEAQRQIATGIGEGLSLLGRTAQSVQDQSRQVEEQVRGVDHEIMMRERERDDATQSVSVGVEQAKAIQRLRVWQTDNQHLVDFESRNAEQVDKEVGSLQGLIGNNERVAERFAVPLAEWSSREKADAAIHAATVRASVLKTGVETAQDIYANSTSPNDYAAASNAMEAMVNGLTGVDDAMKPALHRHYMQPIAANMLNREIEAGRGDAVKTMLDKGLFDWVEPSVKKALTQRIEVEANQTRIAAASVVAGQQRALSDQVEAVGIEIGNGVDVPFARIEAARQTAHAIGDVSALAKLDGFQADVATNRAFRPLSEAQRGATVEQLQAAQNAGRATPVQQRVLQRLRGLNKTMIAEEVAPLKEQYGQGAAGRMAAATHLDTMPFAARVARAEAIKPGFAAIVTLPPETRAIAIEGEDDLPAVAKHFSEGSGIQAKFDSVMGIAGRSHAMADELSVAKSIYAWRARSQGLDKFDPALFANSVSEALGGRKVNGVWQGGIGEYQGQRVILPQGRSAASFSATVNGFTFESARIVGGAKVSKADALAHYRPVMLGYIPDRGITRYGWVDNQGGKLASAKGGDFTMDVAD